MEAGGSHPKVKQQKSSENLHKQQVYRTLSGGHEGDRTLDLTDANRTLSRRRKKYAPKK